MAKKTYAILNLSYKDRTKQEDYLLEAVDGKSSFNIPINMGDTQYMYPSELSAFICQDALRSLETSKNIK